MLSLEKLTRHLDYPEVVEASSLTNFSATGITLEKYNKY